MTESPGPYQFSQTADLVLCLDATGSMTPLWEMVVARAASFPFDIIEYLTAKNRLVEPVRVRVVIFRDTHVDVDPIVATDFFVLPDDASAFTGFLGGIVVGGSADEPESGLEALAVAIHSEWRASVPRCRQVIVLMTDASAHPFGRGLGNLSIALRDQIPDSFEELSESWSNLSVHKRLIVLAPGVEPWRTLVERWECALLLPSVAGTGIEAYEYEELLWILFESI